MARTPGTTFKGTLEAPQPASVKAATFFSILSTAVEGYQPDGFQVPAWELVDRVNGLFGPNDLVFCSRGDRRLGAGKGDTLLYFRLHEVTRGVQFEAYRDWSNRNKRGAGQVVIPPVVFPDAAEVRYWAKINETEIAVYFACAEFAVLCALGVAVRSHVAQTARGVFFSTTPIRGSSTMNVIRVDRDCFSSAVPNGRLQIGQQVTIWNPTPLGHPLRSLDYDAEETVLDDLTPVTATITCERDHAPGALIGLDPVPLYQVSSSENIATLSEEPLHAVSGSPCRVIRNNGKVGGSLQHLSVWTLNGHPISEGGLITNEHQTEKWWAFPRFFGSSQQVLAMGPGAY